MESVQLMPTSACSQIFQLLERCLTVLLSSDLSAIYSMYPGGSTDVSFAGVTSSRGLNLLTPLDYNIITTAACSTHT